MSIKALCAAAAVVVGVGQAEAAGFKYELTYVDTRFWDVSLQDADTGEFIVWGEDYLASEDPWGIPTAIPGILPGDKVIFTFFANASGRVRCNLGGFDCHPGYDPYWSFWKTDPLLIYNEDIRVSFAEEASIGTSAYLMDFSYGGGHYFRSGNYYGYAEGREAEFFVSNILPAPVPLPATAALLPIGIGALALMRKRRRPA